MHHSETLDMMLSISERYLTRLHFFSNVREHLFCIERHYKLHLYTLKAGYVRPFLIIAEDLIKPSA